MPGNYPDYTDPLFNQKIFEKRESKFNMTESLSADAELETESAKRCGDFRLSNTQKFLKSFMNGESPYRSLLLYHGTGTGKTCSSISITEQFSEELERNHKKIIVVLNPSIQENFRKNIFNIQKYKSKRVNQQCLRDKYLKMIKSKKFRNDEELMKKINRKINAKYKFIGYQALVNMLAKWEREPRINLADKISEYFDGSVMIIDEVHNIGKPTREKRDTATDLPEPYAKTSKLPKFLHDIVSSTKNLKLLLLSATPMFNEPVDIVPLLNLLRVNVGLPVVKSGDLFKGRILKSPELLIEASRGLVSYLRSENPLAFPKRLYPDSGELINNFPVENFRGERLADDERIRGLKLVPCVMKKTQLKHYEDIEGSFGSFESVGINVSNIVFPNGTGSETANLYSQEGLFQNFIKNHCHKKFSLMPNFQNPETLDFLKLDKIAEYSAKIKAILENIKKCKNGIVFVYSRYVWAGVVSIALALEVAGAKNINGNLINFRQVDYRDPRNVGKHFGLEDASGKTLPSPGKLYAQDDTLKNYSYALITGNRDLSDGTYKKYLSIEPNNKNGERVKIILGSESASEGLDFKYIREVHMLDPWFHLNKLEQVIGRGIRNCSHIDLPQEQRNVTVYHYATVKPGKVSETRETIDLKIYREAENKDINIANVENILKTNAVDCEANKGVNLFIGPPYNTPIEMIDSRNNSRMETLNDEDYSRICNYGLCSYSCGVNNKSKVVDESTFDYKKMTDNIDECVDDLIEIFRHNTDLTLGQIIAQPSLVKYQRDPEIVYLALNKIISDEIPLLSKHNRNARLVYAENYYITVDEKYYKSDKSGMRIKLKDVKGDLPKRTMKINLTPKISNFVGKRTFKNGIRTEDPSTDTDSIFRQLFEGETQLWELTDKYKNIIYRFIWGKIFLEKMGINQILETKMRELFPVEKTREMGSSIEELLTKANDKSMEAVKMKVSLMIIEWYFTKILTDKGIYWFSLEEKAFKFIEWNTDSNSLIEREPGSTEYGKFQRRMDIKSLEQKDKLEILMGFIGPDAKFKIRDNVKKSKGKNTGRECETYTGKNIIDYISSPLLPIKFPIDTLKKKDNLCLILMLSMIASNTPERHTFLTLEDAVSQKLIKN